MQILIADDDPWLCDMLRSNLTHAGHAVQEAPDGQMAWEAWQRGHFRMLITDWMMPVVDGLELIRRIRTAQRPTYTYILVLTVRDREEDVVRGFEIGADDYLTKPFSLNELRARVLAGERILEMEARLNEARHRMEQLAMYDSLTGLLNRRAIEEHAGAELNHSVRAAYPVSLIMLDTDGFKEVNDHYGHSVGDQALRLVADVLMQNMRPYDWAGRWGGDEFLVVLPQAGPSEAKRVAERVRARLAAARLSLPGGRTLQLQVSMGVISTSTESGARRPLEALLQQADQAMYSAKRQGRNQVSFSLSN